MPKLLLVLLLAGTVLPVFAAKRVTVEELDQLLTSAAHGKSDAKIAQQLSELELTERLSATDLSRWESALPGPESKRSLVVLSDVSAFLDPPASEIPATATPDIAAQRQMMALTVAYVGKTLSRLPNFFATRDTISFEDTPQSYRPDMSAIPYQPLHALGRSSDTVLYRDGKEVVDSNVAKSKRSEPQAQGLVTTGVFGPILGTVLVDAAQGGKLSWSHWEEGAAGPQAVFYYVVPKEKSHYEVEYCCVVVDNTSHVFQQFSGYHGLIAVDPVNGTLLRVTLEADLKPSDPLVKSEILVEYGPVEIGGKTYICPLKSVSLSTAPMLQPRAGIQSYRNTRLDSPTPRDHLQTSLNDVVFEQYHLFRADSHIVTADNREADRNPSASAVTDVGRTGPAEVEKSGSTVPAVDSGEAPPVEKTVAVATEIPTPAPEPATPEISVAEATGLPESSVARPALDKGFTLRVTTRLVDLDVVAYDKKGHPVTDLKPEEFEVYDNGRKQEVRFFSEAADASEENSAKAPEQWVFSNRRAAIGDAKPGTETTEGNVTVLLIDASNLAWQDLNNARAETLRFLQKLSPDQRVGLYVMKARGFQVLEEGTVDHALIASQLRQWMPSAQDLSRSQQLEQRNRQQFDEVLNPTDLQYVNGNTFSAPETASPVDPNLRTNGSNPGRDALPILAGVARHLAAIPGHKNLVWVTSDNVLADWNDKSVSSDDKGSRHIDAYVLRTQEALNDAHVSIYPLDASQLEGQAIDPSLKNRNVELSPSVTAPPQPQGGGPAGGRLTADLQQSVHPIQIVIQDMAEATGGRAFSRSADIAAELNGVVADGRATYLLGFTPDAPADGQYHQLTVKLIGRRGVTLRSRTGYLYSKEPATLKDRFRQAIWQQFESSEIAVSANPVVVSTGTTLKLNIATNNLALKQQDDRWVDKLDIFMVQRNDEGLDARITGQTLSLTLKSATYEKLLQEGIQFEQTVRSKQDMGSVRIVIVDENSGRMGSVTVPATALQSKK